ncbi:MAG: hypothetical protein LBR47_03995 [Spirochaetaceae bacterium]|jgi:hypothetical protein|nr:hypothetical protein [Spirochaetaceae bacterium]
MDNYSAAAQVIIAVIPIVGIVIGGIVIFFYLLWRHKQVSLMIKSGNYKPPRFEIRTFSLLAGTLLLGIGAVLTIMFVFIDGFSYSLLGGLIPLAVGIGLLVYYRFTVPQKHEDT